MKKLLKPVSLFLVVAALAGLLVGACAAAGAPIAENLELRTYRGVSVGGLLSATDPDGGALRYEITTKPVKGEIVLDDDGHFVYTPADGKRGKDYFGYQALDTDGNRSQEATVIIRIEKQKSKVTYSDLGGSGSAYAAVRLAEEGVFCGEYLAGEYVFDPNHPVTREEFLALCMKVSGAPLLSGVRSTGFSDDRDIAVWAKPYVSTALKNGVISGYADSRSGAVFAPEREISALEAAVILNRSMELTDAVSAWVAWDDGIPAWAMQSAANLAACGLLPYGCRFTDSTLTRAQAAEMLCGVMDILARR